MPKPTVRELVMEYFENHPNQELPHAPVLDWVDSKYEEAHGRRPLDTRRRIRDLCKEGKLVKICDGIYKYDPALVHDVKLRGFSETMKRNALEKDGYRCVLCGRGRKDGVTLTVDHVIPRDKGGPNTLENAQTLCSQHNLMKKNYSQTEAGKRYFIKMYQTAVANQDEKMIAFCRAVFDVYDEHGIDLQIARPDAEG